MTEKYYQHKIPQPFGDDAHEVVPDPDKAAGYKDGRFIAVRVCKECGEPIKEVDADDGPEGLKAMLRLF